MHPVIICSASSAFSVHAEPVPSPVAIAARFVVEALERRLLYSAGQLDTTFGPGGSVAVFHPAQAVNDLAVQSDGKIVALGYGLVHEPVWRGWDFTLARFNVDGTRDMTFGDNGLVMTDVFGDSEYSRAVAIQVDGKILAAGGAGTIANTNGYQRFTVVRYNADGSLDATFGDGGIVAAPMQSNVDFVADMAALPDGKVLVLGYSWAGAADYTMMRFNADGSFDATFGNNGIATADLGAWDRAASLALCADGKFVAAGNGDGNSLQVARFNADGSMDSTFGDGGAVTFDGFRDECATVTVQPDGGVLLGGAARSSRSLYASDLALIRLHHDGSLDTAFADNGRATTVLTTVAYSRSLVLQDDGKIVQVAEIEGSGTAVFRYNPDGSLDTTFGDGGIRVVSGSHPRAAAIGVNGKILIGASAGYGGFVISRLTGDGESLVDDDATNNVVDDPGDDATDHPAEDDESQTDDGNDGDGQDNPDDAPADDTAHVFTATMNDRLFATDDRSSRDAEGAVDLLGDDIDPLDDPSALEAMLK